MHGRPGQPYDEVIGAQVLLGYSTQQQQQQHMRGSRRRLFSRSKDSSFPTAVPTAAADMPDSHHSVRLPTGGVPASRRQRGQQPLRVQLAAWWDDWLSCGIKRSITQQQQQQQRWHCTVSKGRQEQQQEQEHVKQRKMPGVAGCTGVVGRRSSEQRCIACQQLLAAMQLAGLSYLLAALPAGLDAAADDWGSVLSPGEMQRMGFARVLLHKPLLAVLDEATSSLPGEDAVQLYQQLQQAGVSYVSVGHSSSLLRVHGQVLSISADRAGGWQLQCVQPEVVA
ncbi:hypothetical protein COO60DRAFT_508708 [Scenedesmus sp. NREL 46B-D3]|nr:hypothetical protein COO60DRAFT_508708 [Scenedesmus sp. NREL 46B-D3]